MTNVTPTIVCHQRLYEKFIELRRKFMAGLAMARGLVAYIVLQIQEPMKGSNAYALHDGNK